MRTAVRICLSIAVLAALSIPSVRAEEDSAAVVDMTYVGDVLHNARGGLKTGTAYLDDLLLQATFDLEKLAGLSGATFFASGHAITFGDFGSRYTGEFQAVSSIDASPAVRLYEAWYQQVLFADPLSLRVGLYDLNSEFDANEPALLFLNSSHGIGPDFSQAGLNGPSIYPVTSLAARLAWQDPSGVTAAFAVLDGVPGDPAHPKRTAIKLGNGDGALLVGEVDYAWSGGRVGAGGWGYTARFDDLVATTPAGPVQRGGNRGAYALASLRVLGDAEATPSVDTFVRVGVAATSMNPVSTYIGAGVVGTGLIPSRPEDQAGLSVAIARTGHPFRSAGVIAGAPVTHHETVFEATYRAALTSWLTLQPDAQLIVNPGFDPTLRNAVVVGFRFEISPLALLNK